MRTPKFRVNTEFLTDQGKPTAIAIHVRFNAMGREGIVTKHRANFSEGPRYGFLVLVITGLRC